MATFMIQGTHIDTAVQRISAYILKTPLSFSHALSKMTGANVYFKCEHLQHTGSFKVRGALNKILSLSKAELAQGVTAASTGNHGLAVAYSAALLKVNATIFLPAHASAFKIAAIKDLGAEVVLVDGDCLQAENTARKESQSSNCVFISPYNDPDVIAGQGTIGVEILADLPNVDAVFISVGGGGLIGGIGSYLKQHSPNTQIIGCWPENAPAMQACLKAGKIIDVPELPTLSEATAGGVEEGAITFEICQNVIKEAILVSEQEIAAAMRLVGEYERYLVEGAAGVALAGFLKRAKDFKNKNIVIVLCGRNMTLEKYLMAMA